MANAEGVNCIARSRVAFAIDWLEKRGMLAGRRSHRLSARVDPGLLNAARARLGQGSDSELITAALAVLAGGDDFGPWLVSEAGATTRAPGRALLPTEAARSCPMMAPSIPPARR